MIKKFSLLFLFLIVLSCGSEADTTAENPTEDDIVADDPQDDPQATFQLVWSDEFNSGSEVATDNWTFETVAPENGGWYNGEKQHYTNRIDNAFVSDGTLKIVAKKETYTSNGSTQEYTSARLNSKFKFTYGKVTVRAKLPQGKGTWPAIWMLGSNINTAGWPACGEIDIMEHWGHDAKKVHSATHTPSCSGATNCNDARVGTTTVNDFATEFHEYGMIWNADEISFYLDDKLLYKYNPTVKNSDTWPFTADQYILLNVAMGGDWFSIDPNFVASTMEVDYVRVYQKK